MPDVNWTIVIITGVSAGVTAAFPGIARSIDNAVNRRIARFFTWWDSRSVIAADAETIAPPVGDWRATVIEPGSIAPDLWTEIKDWNLAGDWCLITRQRFLLRTIAAEKAFAELPAIEPIPGAICAIPRWSWSNFPGPFGMNYPPPVVPPSPYKWSRYETCWDDPLPPFRPALADTRFFDPRDQEHVDFLATAMRNNQLAAQQLATAQAQQESALGQVLNFVATYGPLLVFGAAGAFADFTNRRGPE